MIYYTYANVNDKETMDVLSYPPEKLSYPINKKTSLCPALRKNRDWWVIRSPYTYHLKHTFAENGESNVELLSRSSFQDRVFESVVHIEPKEVRNQENIPLIQFTLYTAFFTKEKDVTMEIFPAFMSHKLNKQPLVSIHGSFPISDWIRPINFAFDWVEPDKEILIERGDPLIYVRFSKNLQLKYQKITPELQKKIDTCSSMAFHYSGQNWKWMFKHMRDIIWK